MLQYASSGNRCETNCQNVPTKTRWNKSPCDVHVPSVSKCHYKNNHRLFTLKSAYAHRGVEKPQRLLVESYFHAIAIVYWFHALFLIEYNFWFICIKCIAIRYAKDMNLVVIANVRNKMSKQIWQDWVRTCLELASNLSYSCGHRNLTIPGWSTPRESTKTTSMEDVSTEVLEKK